MATHHRHFWRFVDKEGDCWVWIGPTAQGKPLHFADKQMSAQQFALQLEEKARKTRRLINKRATIIMRCRNPLCVKPAHMHVERAFLVKKRKRKWPEYRQ